MKICSPFAAILYSWQKFWISSSVDNASAMISIGFIFWKIMNFCNINHYYYIKKAFNLTHVIIIVFARAEEGSFPDFSAVIKIRYWCTIRKKALIFNDSSISEFRKKFFTNFTFKWGRAFSEIFIFFSRAIFPAYNSLKTIFKRIKKWNL